PTFGGVKNAVNALKLVAYGSTAGFVGGIFGLIPSLGMLGLLAALYSIYLIYTGVPVLMKTPSDKAGGYTAGASGGGHGAGGGLGGLAALAGWAHMTVDKETSEEVEKVYKQGNRTVREAWHKDGSRAEVMLILENGVLIEARGDKVDAATLKQVVDAVDPDKVEGMKRVAKQ